MFHAQAIFTPVGDRPGEDRAAAELRKLACELRSKIGSVPFYDRWAAISPGFLPRRASALEASKNLLGLSNSVHNEGRSEVNGKRIAKIERLLGFEPLEE